jgi:hypothetical protein
MNVSKLINYSMDMCWNGQGTTIYDLVKACASYQISPWSIEAGFQIPSV